MGDNKWQVYFLPAWCAGSGGVGAVRVLWALGDSFTHSTNTYAAHVLCQELGIKQEQNKIPCPCGADILTGNTDSK